MIQSDTQQSPPDDGRAMIDEEVYVFPVSFAQQRMWFLDQFEPNSAFYNIPSAFRLQGELAIAALAAAIAEIVQRHEALRTTFATRDGQPVQVIHAALEIPLRQIDLRHLPPSAREAEAQKLANAEAQQPFDLRRGPLLRTTLLRLAERDFILLVTMHHIVSDGWSMGVFIHELTTLYHAFTRGLPSPLPELPIQYADFAEWQRQWLTGEVLERQIAYWKKQLGGSLPVLELPTDRPRPAVQTYRGANEAVKISARLLADLKELSRRAGTTLFMTLLAAFKVLLHRYTGLTDICVGTPVANRNRAEIESLIGVFINTLVLRSDLSGDPGFRELLRRVREVALEAYAHQDVPFETLIEVLQPERDTSHSSLFQVMFILQNAAVTAQQLPGLTITPVEAETGTSTFDLTLSLAEEAEGMEVAAEYNTDLFEAATIRRLLGNYLTLLDGVVADPDQRLSRLPLLSPAERRQILVEWNDTRADFPAHRCVHHLFERQVELAPQAVAVACNGQYLTYDQLNRRANQLAHHLQKLGVGPEVRVAIAAEKSPEMIVAVMAVMKAGGAYVPLDPSYPQERLAYMLEDSGAAILLTQHRLLPDLPPFHGRVFCLDADWPQLAGESESNPVSAVRPENLIYAIYTSGSTGRAKGTLLEHRTLVNQYLAWEKSYTLLTVARSHLQMASFSFDVFSGDFVRALCSGGKLVLCPREVMMAPDQLYALMRREQVNCAEFVPAVLRGLIQYLDETGQKVDFMRLLIAGSDTWYVSEYKKFQRFCGPDTRLINSFGLTEATIDSTFFETGGKLDLPDERVVPIGRPFANSKIYILDANLEPVPIGVAGEICVGGAGLARGYHHLPEMTATKFVPDPFSGIPGSRMYRTGDLGRFLPDGNIEFIGRIDHQAKIRGYRIELGEIETALAQHPQLKAVAALVREDKPGEKRLVAYIVPANETVPGRSELRKFLLEKVPEYMVPSDFVTLAALPLTPNGKVDRRALPAPDRTLCQPEEDFIAPRTPVEEILAGIWSQVLRVGKVGAFDNFFDLGGHSLLATQVVSRVRDVLRVELPLRDIFEFPTLAGLAEKIEILSAAQGVEAPPIRPVPRTPELPLSFAQQRLWFLDQLEPNSPFYNIPEAVRLTGGLEAALLEKSLNEIVRRHEVLRTTFVTLDGKPRQVIAPALTIPLKLIDLSPLPAAEREAEARRLARHEAQQPFDLSTGPLLRATLLRLQPDEHVMLLTLHHIISDDWSTSVLIQEMAVLYEAFSKGKPSPLPELPVQYADFAAWQRQWLQGEVLAAQLDYWKRQLHGIPALLELPTDRPRPAMQSYRGDYQTFSLSAELSAKIRALARREGVTHFMTLLAAWQALLARYSGQDDICVGTPIANRNRAELEPLIGFFVNTLVLRGDLSGDPGFRLLLQRVRDAALGAYAHQDVPFEKIVDALAPERDMSHAPLFQVMFALQNTPLAAQGISPGLTLSPFEAHSGTAKFDLTLFMVEEEDHFSGALEYNTDLFDAATISRLLAHFERLLDAATAEPDRPLSRLPLLTAGEAQKVLVEWNGRRDDQPLDRCLHQRFEQQAAETPAAVAVRYNGELLSYDELNRRANRLARHLQKCGVGPEVLVGLCLERSPAMLVALLAVMKAGGAYVPLDPAYPRERLAFMLEDSRVALLLSQRKLLERLPAHDLPVILLDEEAQQFAGEEDSNLPVTITPDNLVYVIYTSGSTGRPKGTLITHRGLNNYLNWCLAAYPLSQGSGALVHSPLAFDATVTGLFSPLLVGKTVQLVPEGLEIEALSRVLETQGGFSLIKITPAHLDVLGQQLGAERAGKVTAAFVIGGENLTAKHIAFWRRHAPATLLFNEYGPTETVVGCVVYCVPPDWPGSEAVPIGRAIPNTRVYVLDSHLQPVPIGVPGELYIGGAGVARGYLNRPDLTAERFVPDPFCSEPGARMYKTGDLVRYLASGEMEYLGRRDDQVKIRGYRIELGEVEAVLAKHPGLREAAVVAHTGAGGERRLVAYVVPAGEAAPTAAQLREFLRAELPEYMIPASFITLAALPLTPNGKVDRRSLPAPGENRPELENVYVAPRTPAEQTLAAIWQQVLGVSRVGVHDNFFELGGDSILSIQVIARAKQAGLGLTPRQLFEHPTVAGLAAVAGATRAMVAEQGPVTGPVPLTPIQHWFFEQNVPEPHHWNQSVFFALAQPLDPSRLRQVVSALLQHHDALRLRFQRNESGWQQYHAGFTAEEPESFVMVNLAALPAAEQSAAITAEAARLQASLHLGDGPLLRVAYFDLGETRPARLLIVAHHLVMDGVSWQILLQDFLLAYQQLGAGQPPQLPPKTTSYQQWAQRLVEHARSETVRDELAFWQKLLESPTAALPLDFPAGRNTEASAAEVTVALSEEETATLLREVPAAYHTEINEVLLTALAAALAEWTGMPRVRLDLEGHGREDLFPDLEVSRTVGWFTTIYPVVLDLTATATTVEALSAVRDQLRRIPLRGFHYGLLRYLCADDEQAAGLRAQPPAPVLFNYLGQRDHEGGGPAWFTAAPEAPGAERSPAGLRTHVLELNGGIQGGRLEMEWTFSTHLHRRETIAAVAENFKAKLQEIIARCRSAGDQTAAFADFGWDQQELAGILQEIDKALP
ncbi:MAG: amino acid adenylation domain-containing protein [candidate division KSB1 bacterium]|nr:amino acid adenylation domain-containing protein [candidate division KSB1 bacterium]MDZ7288253.1 amino acid adenylation domain-containing protein [candidate division KSB1 bacterium]MDZ7300356.1 amino acid adenylation domain-containing protein [candidate division KSB1 bacterium]MDZ7307316.1 amino acid adenylation domain-containing protein [candidate division KSB1 bacterium]MDZ7351356.1 amino acid adenylation domain-containing protein [candidate division KSB1 bacterium]